MNWSRKMFVFYSGEGIKEGNLSKSVQIDCASNLKEVGGQTNFLKETYPTGAWYEYDLQWSKSTKSFKLMNPKLRIDL